MTPLRDEQPLDHDVAALERALAGTDLAGLGPALVAAEAETGGVNAVLLAAIIAHESGWGVPLHWRGTKTTLPVSARMTAANIRLACRSPRGRNL